MIRLVKAVVLAAATAAMGMAGAAWAEVSPAGTWQTISDTDGKPRAVVRVDVRNGEVSATIVGTLRDDPPDRVCDKCPKAKRGQKILGMEFLWGLKQDRRKPLQFEGGQIIDPETGAQYSARATLSPDGNTLTVRGFVGMPSLGRSQIWKRQS